jgi:hypothetical protein
MFQTPIYRQKQLKKKTIEFFYCVQTQFLEKLNEQTADFITELISTGKI